MEKNQISPPLKFGSEEFQIMTCDIKKIKPILNKITNLEVNFLSFKSG